MVTINVILDFRIINNRKTRLIHSGNRIDRHETLTTNTICGFVSFARKIIADYKLFGKSSAVEHYSAALNSFIRFYGDNEISFVDFNSDLMLRYENYLKNRGRCPNTTSYYMRKLRAIYNKAVEAGLTPQNNPFKHVYTGVAKTNKRALSLDTIKALRDMELQSDPLSAYARDMFLFSFYTRGMAMIDMSYLKKSNLHNGILTYRRKKTGQQLIIKWEQPMQEIVTRYNIEGSEYLLPMIKPDGNDNRRQYLNASHLINKYLKKLGIQLGLSDPLTMYRARHSWASIAQSQNVPISVISQGMGHDSEHTTRIYLDSIDTTVIDKANNKIINLLTI